MKNFCPYFEILNNKKNISRLKTVEFKTVMKIFYEYSPNFDRQAPALIAANPAFAFIASATWECVGYNTSCGKIR